MKGIAETLKQRLWYNSPNLSINTTSTWEVWIGRIKISYRIAVTCNKWWWALFSWVPDMIMQNAWILYKRFKSPKDPNHGLLSFRREVVAVYFSKYSKEKASQPTSSSRISNLSSMSKKPCLMMYASIDLATFRNEAILTKDVQNVERIQKMVQEMRQRPT